MSDKAAFTYDDAVDSITDQQSVEVAVQRLLAELTEDERLSLLYGDQPFWPGIVTMFNGGYCREPYVNGHIPRLGIPGIRFTDGPRGIVVGGSTAFPVAMARGATWDIGLEKRIGTAIGLEGRAQGANFFGGICINLPRHPAWGRIQEVYGEDPLILGKFGAAISTGVRQNLMACVKHFALNSMENARFRVDVSVDDAALHEVYLAHFRTVVDAGVDSVMSAYNSVRGEWAGQNKELLTDILRDQWNFDGYVISDFIFGLRDAPLSVKNGLDIEAPFIQQRARQLPQALKDGKLAWSEVDRACARILKKQLQHARSRSSETPDFSVVFCKQHRELAREAAAKSIVLLKNDRVDGRPVLPLVARPGLKVALIGRLANLQNTGDRGSSHVHAPHVVTAVEGLQAAFPGASVIVEDSGSVEKARKCASEADIVVCMAGYTHEDEGEYMTPSVQSDPDLLKLFPPPETDVDKQVYQQMMNIQDTGVDITGSGAEKSGQEGDKPDDADKPGKGGDRSSLRLRPQDVDIISAISEVNRNVVVSIVTGGPVIMEEWIESVPAVLFSWYSGTEGGHALADVLLGKVDASGRLPFSIPKSEQHLPDYEIDATAITYDKWYGQRLLDKMGEAARFALGFGLSYTAFATSALTIDPGAIHESVEDFTVTATVTNTGERRGRHIAQVYGLPDLADFPSRVLLGFEAVDLDIGESKQVTIIASVRPLLRWSSAGWIRPGKDVEVELSAFHGDPSSPRSRVFV